MHAVADELEQGKIVGVAILQKWEMSNLFLSHMEILLSLLL
jgi:hypothetical protein